MRHLLRALAPTFVALFAMIGPEGWAAAAEIGCQNLAPSSSPGPDVASRAIEAMDLVRLRDVGWPASVALEGPSAVAVSPDGRKAAFQIRRADPDANSYCMGMFVVEIGAPAHLIEVDAGGELIRQTLDRTGITAFPTGVPKVITPHWSPDGLWIAFLKRERGATQIWRARSDGSTSEALTTSDVDIEDLAWSADGRAIIFASKPKLQEGWRAIDSEARSGFLFDDRFVPKASSRPFPYAPSPLAFFTLDMRSRAVRPAMPSERALLDPASDAGRPQDALLFATSRGSKAWTRRRDPDQYIPTTQLRAITATGKMIDCATEVCTHIVGLWWTPDGRALRFFRQEGWGLSQLALYDWTPGHGMPHRAFRTDDLLADCHPTGRDLLCLHESSDQPRRLVRVSENGQIRPVLDFNPEFREIRLGRIERLTWRNDRGIETFGDLVLPPDHRPGQRHPLIIVQYDSRGFLRGGTGDEYPIQLFAAHGFAVLSFERPREVGLLSPSRNGDELERNNMKDWADLRSVLSSLEQSVHLLVTRGVVDPERIGITGLSDGTRTTQYALLHSTLFAAASVSSSFEEPGTLIPLAGSAAERNYVGSGYPARGDENEPFWACYSLARNASRIRSPILMQLAEDEYLGSLETAAALRQHHVPHALYVFPGEHHIKWQPVHRFAVYERNLAWFEYWLQGGDHVVPEAAKWLDLPALSSLRTAASRPDSRSLEGAAPIDQCRAQASASASASSRR
jgi:dipeptidyl aminopeptidase/acylaminoacyl peptidase